MLKVAILGCGKIADAHAQQIQQIRGCEIVGVCDREELMARQLFERFRVKAYFADANELLEKAKPDVVHISTPPQSHYELARTCLLHGSHVYVEKPMTLNAQEAVELINLAQAQDLKITVGHDDQFRHAARRLRELVRAGYLGDGPLHLESYYCYELNEKSSYAKALLADNQHWVRRLPGMLLQNIISHGVARIAEFLKTDAPQVIALGFPSPLLRKRGESAMIDELRVIITEQERTTAYLTFSSQIRPSLHQFRVFGDKNGVAIDQDQETLIRLRGRRLKSYLEQFLTPVELAWQYVGNSLHNLRLFASNDFHPKAGMRYLIEAFYASIRDGAPLPISYREILLTARIMDEIFSQTHRGLEHIAPDKTFRSGGERQLETPAADGATHRDALCPQNSR